MPQGRFRPLEDLRQEVGPDLSDDDLLLKIVIPGWSAKGTASHAAGAPAARAAETPGGVTVHAPSGGVGAVGAGLPMAFNVEVDGEVFAVMVNAGAGSAGMGAAGGAGGAGGAAGSTAAATRSKELVPGAVVCGMGGLIVSIRADVGDRIEEGDVIATIEAMKMIREVGAPRSGVVQEILVAEGDLVAANDVLMVVH